MTCEIARVTEGHAHLLMVLASWSWGENDETESGCRRKVAVSRASHVCGKGQGVCTMW